MISTTVSLGLVFFLTTRRQAPGARYLVALMVTAIVWTASYTAELHSAELGAKLMFSRIGYLGITTIAPLWLGFALAYTHNEWALDRRRYALLFVVPVLTIAIAWTSGFHNLLWQDVHLDTSGSYAVFASSVGPWFWFHALYAYGLLAIGNYLLTGRGTR